MQPLHLADLLVDAREPDAAARLVMIIESHEIDAVRRPQTSDRVLPHRLLELLGRDLTSVVAPRDVGEIDAQRALCNGGVRLDGEDPHRHRDTSVRTPSMSPGTVFDASCAAATSTSAAKPLAVSSRPPTQSCSASGSRSAYAS